MKYGLGVVVGSGVRIGGGIPIPSFFEEEGSKWLRMRLSFVVTSGV